MTENMYALPSPAQEFLEYLKTRGRKDSTITRYHYDLADFFRFVEVSAGADRLSALDEATTHRIEEYFAFLVQSRDYQQRTIKRIHTVLKQHFEYLHSTGRRKDNPMKAFDPAELTGDEFTSDDLIHPSEEKKLMKTLQSDAGLSEKQAAARPLLAPRNLVIIRWFLRYGLRLQELASLCLKDMNQGQGQLFIPESTGNPRVVSLSKKDQSLLYHYFQVIPKPVRPFLEDHPVFAAFDFQRRTYRWSYEEDRPKQLTEVAIQKMIRMERKRAGIERSISSKHLRNTFIVRALESGLSPEYIQETLGLNTILTLTKYIDYAARNNSTSKNSSF
ncbi:tyrosine-type recombinase/integrase [Salibacterium qingdaonense]|uniref:Site-specific recombinase XerD n=1 Tax=Salibacterium qingdaonense TaxID=266892 RepID=A0A1I4K8G9_9BACI|nr:tyrosine-type recombinase/integrase [Salibacterium qingdaonense]SFL74877.1 Site-specific recombinase XerD [Salibacterium qingdaonense]